MKFLKGSRSRGKDCKFLHATRAQAAAIAENILKMFELKVPVIAYVIGEGGSGGALGDPTA